MDWLDALGLARQVWPRLAAFVVLAAFYFFPQLSTDLIVQAAHERAERVLTVFSESFEATPEDPQRHRPRH
jgi:hypothetical protein